jgi:hypothetical protein
MAELIFGLIYFGYLAMLSIGAHFIIKENLQ